jgi:HemY protein
MLRILIFVISVAFFAFVLTALAYVDGRTTAEAFGLKFDFHTGGAAIILVLIFGAAIVLTSVFKDLKRLPRDLRIRLREARRARGVAAAARGLEAVAVGDAEGARRHARVAERNLEESALTRLLSAQAAQLAGDEAATTKSFSAMLAAPETEFVGLRGLYLQAMRSGDKAAARAHAERAFRLRPNAAWAFDSVFSLGLDAGAWSETREALKAAVRHGAIDVEKARRGEAALLAADAYEAAAPGDRRLALDEAEAALKLAPSFAPAAALAARLHGEAGRRGRAAKLLEQAFAGDAHPALARAHNDLYKDEPLEKRAEHMLRLAERRPQAREAKLQKARRHLLLSEFAAARRVLEPLLEEAAYADECAMMAEAAAGERASLDGKPESARAARLWLQRAASAPRNPAPGADGEFHFTRDGWARLVREYMEHGRLAPPPLEEGPSGVSADEMKRLAGPDETPPPQLSPYSVTPSTDEDADTDVVEAARVVAAAGEVN